MPTVVHSNGRLSWANRALSGARPVPLRLVRRLLAAGRPGLAETVTRTLVWLRRGDDTLRHVLAVFLWARDDMAGAIRMAGRAIVHNPAAPEHRWLLAAIHETSGRPDRALAVLGEEQPMAEPLPTLRLRIMLHLARGDGATSSRLAGIAHDRFPGKPEPLRLLIAARLRSGDLAAAARLAELACARFPRRADVWLLRATIAERLGDLDTADAMLQRCLERRPGWLAPTRRLVRQRQMKGDPEGARRLATEAAGSIGAGDPARWADAIAMLLDVGCDPPAALLQAVAGDGRAGPEAATDRLGACLTLGDWQGAARAFGAVLAHGAQDARLMAMLAGAGAELDAEASRLGLPAPALVVDKLKRHALTETRADPAIAAADALIAWLVQGQPADDPAAPLVSYVCPAHRTRDLPNLLAQIHRQDWHGAEVIFCINSDEIAEQDLALDPAKGFRARHLRLPPGRSIGYYLNRSIAAARGEILLRLDADDHYDAAYTRCMVGFLRATGADIVSVHPYCFFFESLGQSYLINSLETPLTRDLALTDRQAMGSGSSLCARRAVFDRIGFDEALALGEDVVFYRRAVAEGLRVCTLPGYLHTATRRADKEAHTWQLDDMRILSRHSRYVGEGCVVLRPVEARPAVGDGDLVDRLLRDPALAALRALPIGDALAAVPQPVRLISGPRARAGGPETCVPGAGGDDASGAAHGVMTIAFCPGDPAGEEVLAARHGVLSFRHDIAPRLICGDRAAFARLGGLRRSDRAGFRRRFGRARLRYAILADTDGGATDLCARLASIGLGVPDQHIRAPAAALIAGDPDPDMFLRILLGQIECEGVVGTMLIGAGLPDGASGPVTERVIAWMVAAGFRFVRLAGSGSQAAASAATAGPCPPAQPSRDELAGPALSAPSPAPQDGAVATPKELDRLAQALIPEDRVLRLDHASVAGAPREAVMMIARFLGFTPLPGVEPVGPFVPMPPGACALRDGRARADAGCRTGTAAAG